MSEITNAKLKIIFYVHFVLIVLSQIGTWGSSAFMFYNLLFAFTLLWSLFDHNASEPIQHAILINGASLIFDIILLTLGYPHDGHSSQRFSAAMAILNLVVRPFSILLLHRILQERSGSLGPLEGVSNIFGPQKSAYQDIDKRDVPTTSQTEEQDFFRPAQAQQI